MKQNPQEITSKPGRIALFGSGETSPKLRKVYKYLLERLPSPPKVALLETPAGFELNSDRVIGRIGEYLNLHLQNFNPQVEIIPARRRGSYYSPNNAEILSPLLESDFMFMGPGSPTYAVRHLRDSLAWYLLLARHCLGGTIALSSAATIAISKYALPVYEIYKVGEDLHWKEGLDFFKLYGLPLVFIPHWNNNDGGSDLDTTRCFMGEVRFKHLLKMLPEECIVIGIDELTALIIEPENWMWRVIGKGGVTILSHGSQRSDKNGILKANTSNMDMAYSNHGAFTGYFQAGETFQLFEIEPSFTNKPEEIIPCEVWLEVLKTQQAKFEEGSRNIEAPSETVISMVNEREDARLQKDWEVADNLRDELANLGWEVVDTPEGPQLNILNNQERL